MNFKNVFAFCPDFKNNRTNNRCIFRLFSLIFRKFYQYSLFSYLSSFQIFMAFAIYRNEKILYYNFMEWNYWNKNTEQNYRSKRAWDIL